MNKRHLWVLVLVVISIVGLSDKANAATFLATLQPVQVCQSDGSSCYSSDFDVATFQSVFDQAQITFDILPFTTLDNTSFWDFSGGTVLATDLFDLPTPDGVLVNYFTIGPGLGLSLLGQPSSYTREQGSSGLPNDIHARFLARQVGLSLISSGNLLSDDPLNLLCESSICDFIDPEFGLLSSLQISSMIQGPLVSAVPIPASIWLFGTVLISLVGFSKRRKAA